MSTLLDGARMYLFGHTDDTGKPDGLRHRALLWHVDASLLHRPDEGAPAVHVRRA